MTAQDQDRADWEAWVSAQLARIEHYGAEGNGFDVFDQSKMRAANRWFTSEDAYRGPWRSIRPYVTREFLWWIEAEGQPRITLQEWRTRARKERARRASEVATWHESADFSLSELAMLRDLLARRDEIIATARDRGASWRAICEAAGLSRMQAHTSAKNYRAKNTTAGGTEWVEVTPGEWMEVPA